MDFNYNLDMLLKAACSYRNFIINLVGNFERQQIMAKNENKLFTVAGTARNADGTVKARFANDLVARIKILTKAGCTDINLIELPQGMTKLDALKHLQSVGMTDGDAGFAVQTKLAEKSKVAKKAEVMVAAKGAKASTTKPRVKSNAEQAADDLAAALGK